MEHKTWMSDALPPETLLMKANLVTSKSPALNTWVSDPPSSNVAPAIPFNLTRTELGP